ncbi:MAG: CoA-transferase [Halobacteria archaeon]|nr:CoA-transferase [Halobacteria archaeon]
MEEAVEKIEPGSSIAAGLALEHAIPFGAGHEIIRQGIDGLTLIGPISDMLFDQVIGADLVEGVRAAWVGNVSAGTGYNFRRAVENDEIDVEDHSNFSIALALKAGSMGVPYLPTRSLLGSDIHDRSDLFLEHEDPFSGGNIVLVPSINPDWAIVHVQRSDPLGNAHAWGNTGIAEPAIGAADNVLVTAEEIVSTEVIKSDPNRTFVTKNEVTAVVECPYGAHPSPVSGYYNRDNEYFLDYHTQTKTPDDYEEWADEWVYGVESREEYMELVDKKLDITEVTTAAEVKYGQ